MQVINTSENELTICLTLTALNACGSFKCCVIARNVQNMKPVQNCTYFVYFQLFNLGQIFFY